MSWADILAELRERLSEWGAALIETFPSLVVALIVLTAFGVASRGVDRAAVRLVERLTSTDEVAALAGRLARLIAVGIGVYLALEILQLERTVTSLLAGVGIAGLALGFAFQDLAANFMSGVLIALRRPYDRGDLIRTNGYFGHVDRTTLRATRLRTFSGQIVKIPNRKVLEEPIENFTETKRRRVDLEVGVSYGDDLENARAVAIEALEDVPQRDPEREVEAYYVGFGASSIDLSVRFWHLHPEESFLAARSEAVMRLKRAFDAAGITIPFPIRTLHTPEAAGSEGEKELARVGNRTSRALDRAEPADVRS